MKKTEIWEGVLLLIAALILLPLWLARSGKVQFPASINTLLDYAVYPLVILLGVIFIRRLRRIIAAFRESKNRPGMFS